MRSRALSSSVVVSITASIASMLVACSGASTQSAFGDGGASSSSGGGSSSGIASGSSGGGNGSSSGPIGGSSSGGSSSGSQPGCSAAAELVYVLSTDNDLYSFDPPNKKFTKIGHLGCQTSLSPNSMAVSRDGTAWVNYDTLSQIDGHATAGAIFKVSTADASCQPTNIKLTSQWYHLGMGFSTNGASSTDETLYIASDDSNPTLATLDTTTGTITPVGAFGGSTSGLDAELTGTGDGRLFGFFVPDPSAGGLGGGLGPVTLLVAQIDKTSAATSNAKAMNGFDQPVAWAFSFWGGDFYLYTAGETDTKTTVTHYSPSTGNVDTSYTTTSGFVIDGAGVSTCAPTTPVK